MGLSRQSYQTVGAVDEFDLDVRVLAEPAMSHKRDGAVENAGQPRGESAEQQTDVPGTGGDTCAQTCAETCAETCAATCVTCQENCDGTRGECGTHPEPSYTITHRHPRHT